MKMMGGSVIGVESLAGPKKEVLCRASICFLPTGNYSYFFYYSYVKKH
jgi:hypothetical protein